MLVMRLRKTEVIVIHTSDGPVVIYPTPDNQHNKTDTRPRIGIEAPECVKIERIPIEHHPPKLKG